MQESEAKKTISKELVYLLHAHKRESPEDIVENLSESVKVINPQTFSFNQKVMVALIQEGFIRELMKKSG